MKPFKVVWEIEVDGENATDAALTALEIMRDKQSEALAFTVSQLSTGEEENVDLFNKNEGS